MSGVHDFDKQVGKELDAFEQEQLQAKLVGKVIAVVDKLTDDQKETLLNALALTGAVIEDQQDYDANFDLSKEINEQLRAIRAMRQQVFNSNHTIKDGISAREVKEVVTSSSTMINTLMKHHQTVQSMERHRAVEAATIDALKELEKDRGAEVLNRFFEIFEKKLDVLE